jgi:phosphatidylglycerophosphatase A
MVGILIYLIPGFEQTTVLTIAILIAFVAGVVTSARVAEVEGNRLTKMACLAKEKFQGGDKHETPDPSIVVIDEIVGIWITLMFVPKTWVAVLIAFIAFRVFDILKPPPARNVEQIPNGWGIMLDDVIAGVYACLATHASLFVLRLIVPALAS